MTFLGAVKARAANQTSVCTSIISKYLIEGIRRAVKGLGADDHVDGQASLGGGNPLPIPAGAVNTRLVLWASFHQNDSHLINSKTDVCLFPTPRTRST